MFGERRYYVAYLTDTVLEMPRTRISRSWIVDLSYCLYCRFRTQAFWSESRRACNHQRQNISFIRILLCTKISICHGGNNAYQPTKNPVNPQLRVVHFSKYASQLFTSTFIHNIVSCKQAIQNPKQLIPCREYRFLSRYIQLIHSQDCMIKISSAYPNSKPVCMYSTSSSGL